MRKSGRRGHRSRPPAPAFLIGFALTAVVVGIAVVLFVRGGSAVVSEANGHCGGRFAPACPPGLDAVLLFAFACTGAGGVAVAVLVTSAIKRADAGRPVPDAAGVRSPPSPGC